VRRDTPLNLGALTAVGYEDLVVGVDVVALTVPPTAEYAFIAVDDEAIRWKTGDDDPTSSSGIPVVSGDYINFMDPGFAFRALLLGFKAIRSGDADATLRIEYYG